jgi:hypothetical protein
MLRFPIVEVMTGDQGGLSSYQTGTDPAKSAVTGLTPAPGTDSSWPGGLEDKPR